MEYVRLGSSGLKVSRICLGMMSSGDPASRQWHLGEPESEPIARRAVEAGVTFFDTANMYSEGMRSEQKVVTGTRSLCGAYKKANDGDAVRGPDRRHGGSCGGDERDGSFEGGTSHPDSPVQRDHW
jgi:aldo/keto reductase family protein